jgi:hypothetical protein
MCVCVFVCVCVCVCVCTEPHELLFHVVRITGARHDHLEHVAHFDRHFVFRFREDAGHIWDEGKEVLVDFRAFYMYIMYMYTYIKMSLYTQTNTFSHTQTHSHTHRRTRLCVCP